MREREDSIAVTPHCLPSVGDDMVTEKRAGHLSERVLPPKAARLRGVVRLLDVIQANQT